MSRRGPKARLTSEEEAAIFADIELRKTLTTKALVRKYNVSPSLLYTTWRKQKLGLVSRETQMNPGSRARRKPMTEAEIDALAREMM